MRISKKFFILSLFALLPMLAVARGDDKKEIDLSDMEPYQTPVNRQLITSHLKYIQKQKIFINLSMIVGAQP